MKTLESEESSTASAVRAREPSCGSNATDAELVLAGDMASLDILVMRHNDAVRACIGRVLRCARDCIDDLQQETWRRACKHVASFDPKRPFRPWLLQIARNVCYDDMRERKKESGLVALHDLEGTSLEPYCTKTAELLKRMRDSEEVCRLLALLAADEARALDQTYLQGYSYVEISRATGCSVDTLRSRVFRALKKLREHINQPHRQTNQRKC